VQKKTARATELNVLWHNTGFPSGLSVFFVSPVSWKKKQGCHLLSVSHIDHTIIRKEEKKMYNVG